MKKYLLFALIALFFVSIHSAWADTAFVKLTAENGTVSWIEIKGTITGTNIEISNGLRERAISKYASGAIDLNEVWSLSGGSGTHYKVTTIGMYAFYYCEKLTSIEIPSSVTIIGEGAFEDCTGLTSIAIPSSVTSIGFGAFEDCTGLTSIEIPSGVTSIGHNAFLGCSKLTSIVIPSSVTSIGDGAFKKCSSLTSITIPNSVTRIGNNTFDNCLYLKSITIPSSVTSIGDGAFNKCSSLASITIPNSVTSIGVGAFDNCTSLKKVIVKDIEAWYSISFGGDSSNPLSWAHHLYSDENTETTELIIPNSVTSIGSFVFDGCSGLTSVTIPNSVTSIGYGAFRGCSGLTSITIPNSVTSIGDYAFYGCKGLTFIIIPSSLASIGERVFSHCSGLTSVSIPNSVTNIKKYAFSECSGLTSITIPNSVTNIGEGAFNGCKGLTSIEIPNSVTFIGRGAFSDCTNLTSIVIPSSISSIGNYVFSGCSGLTSIEIPNSVTVIGDYAFSGCSSLTSITIPSSVIRIGWYTFMYCSGLISVTIPNSVIKCGDDVFSGCSGLISTTSTSISTGFYLEAGSSFSFQLGYNGDKIAEVENGHIKFTGLDPMQNYNIYISKITTGLSAKTKELTLTTSQPKVISAGNVIVAAESNLDDEETNVGFEWRRTDWTSEFSSNTGTAYLYNGTMEGYIRNLNTEKLWKYRPYYTSNAGKTYYGEWVGIDPTNTSYFEPTVHTYANVSVNGNSVEVKGYVQRGTDSVVSKGFAYWKESQDVKSREAMSAPSMISSLPSNAKTVEISGSQQVMTASLSNLEYETTYCYVAFVKTSEGDTFYGDVRSFATGADLTGIENVEFSFHEQAIEVARYNINGHRISSPQRGINIVRMSNGTTRKVFVK